jgi:hypothetical protein
MGNKQEDRFFRHFGLYGNDSLDESIKKAGFARTDITDVFLTHLHFDHCGGAVRWNENKTAYELSFPNARYWSNKQHWEWAVNPNEREKASFLSENLMPIQESGQLSFIETPKNFFCFRLWSGFWCFVCKRTHGETNDSAYFLSRKNPCFYGGPIAHCWDICPCRTLWVMMLDPLQTLEEKKRFLSRAADENFVLFMQHDANNPLITVQHTDRGVRLHESLATETLNTF